MTGVPEATMDVTRQAGSRPKRDLKVRVESSFLGYLRIPVATGDRISRRYVMDIIGVIVAGIIIGLLGKFVAPGDKDNIPIWLTILCGIGGVLLGWFIYTAAFGGGETDGVDWMRWLVALVVAAVLVVVASTVTGRNNNKSKLV
jgi:uncharacterized membrane protein YeaQ/YmgE (transglycosylase-associated protein family)